MVRITVLNRKGGVGKTLTTFHLAGAFAKMGLRVLCLDNDPQASLTDAFFGPAAARAIEASGTIAAIFAGERPFPEQVIRETGSAGIDLVPGSRFATKFNTPSPEETGDEERHCLREFLEEVGDASYDVTLIDCPPNLYLASFAALAASDHILVPVIPDPLGANGILDVLESIELVRSTSNPSLNLLGYVLTMMKPSTKVHRGFESGLRSIYESAVFSSMVPLAAAFVDSALDRRPIGFAKPKGPHAKAMVSVAEEILSRIGSPASASPILEVA